jgi:hypothetical protein
MLLSLGNLIPLYLCFKIDKMLAVIDESTGFLMISAVRNEDN